jgi:hypothetical protein
MDAARTEARRELRREPKRRKAMRDALRHIFSKRMRRIHPMIVCRGVKRQFLSARSLPDRRMTWMSA